MTCWLDPQPITAGGPGCSATLAGMPPTQRKSTSSDKPPDDKPDQPETEDVEVRGTGPDGEWRPETHGQSPAQRPKSEF